MTAQKQKPTAKQFLLDNAGKFKNKDQALNICHKATGVTIKRINTIYNHMYPQVPERVNPFEPKGPKIRPRGKSIESFTIQFDWQGKIQKTIQKELEKKGAQVFTDAEFRILCDVPSHKWRSSTNAPEFEPYKVCIRNLWYWSSKANVERIRSLDV